MTVQYSYNGWLASKNPADFGGLDNRVVPGTTNVKLAPGVRAGDVAVVLFYVATQLHLRVESGQLYTDGDEWGFFFRPNKNDVSTISCHGSATAFDWNATRHPNGKPRTFTIAQVREIHTILAEVDNVVRWGGDFSGTIDEMHFEICKNAAAVAKVAARLRAGGTTPPPASKPTPVTARRVLSRGMMNDADVKRLQIFLNARFPAYSQLPVTGNYLDQTVAVVKEFQRRAGVTGPDADGTTVGPRTHAALAQFGW